MAELDINHELRELRRLMWEAREERDFLAQTLRHVWQTVHQAHHGYSDLPLDKCRVGICAEIYNALRTRTKVTRG